MAKAPAVKKSVKAPVKKRVAKTQTKTAAAKPKTNAVKLPAVKVGEIPQFVREKQLAEFWGIAARSVRAIAVEAKVGPGTYDFALATQNYLQSLRESKAGWNSEKTEEIKDAEQRRAVSDADKSEANAELAIMNVQERKAELINLPETIAAIEAITSVIKTNLNNVGARCRNILPGVIKAFEANKIQGVVDEILNDVADLKDKAIDADANGKRPPKGRAGRPHGT